MNENNYDQLKGHLDDDWTTEEIEKLIELSKKHKIDKIAELLNKPRKAVQSKLQRIAQSQNKSMPYAKWTDEADSKLKSLYLEHTTIKELAVIFNRTNGAIRARLKKLGLLEASSGPQSTAKDIINTNYSSFHAFAESVFANAVKKNRDRMVLLHRLGFDDEGRKTLEEIGKSLNLTRERVRQIEKRAKRNVIKHLRYSSYPKLFDELTQIILDNGGSAQIDDISRGFLNVFNWKDIDHDILELIIDNIPFISVTDKIYTINSDTIIPDSIEPSQPAEPNIQITPDSATNIVFTEEQKDIISAFPKGHLLVRGVAGSGKTLIAVERAVRLMKQHTDMFNPADVIIFTYTNALKSYIKLLLSQRGYNNILVTTFHSWALSNLRNVKTAHQEMQLKIIREILSDFREKNVELPRKVRNPAFLMTEFNYMKGLKHTTRDIYIEKPRTGRGVNTRIDNAAKNLIFDIFEAYNKKLESLEKNDLNDVAMLLTEAISNGIITRKFTHIIIDEAQDMHLAQVEAIAELVDPVVSSITLLYDPYQRIYDVGPYSFQDAGINVKGIRSKFLRVSFRSTREVLRLSGDILRNYLGQGDIERYENDVELAPKTDMTPVVCKCSNIDDEFDFITEKILLFKNIDRKYSIIVLARTNRDVEQFYDRLKNKNINAVIYDRKVGFDPADSVDAVIMTIHSAKGIESDIVFIPCFYKNKYPPSIIKGKVDSKEDALNKERILLHTSMTRTRYKLVITFSGEPSTLFEEMNDDHFINIEYMRIVN
ncbi:MAG TPA: 3'-5' exonuclease [Alphaproteobacteria bacterium]|nr:3'-5' exonuclease [Alphaproteobacteria bacterium]